MRSHTQSQAAASILCAHDHCTCLRDLACLALVPAVCRVGAAAASRSEIYMQISNSGSGVNAGRRPTLHGPKTPRHPSTPAHPFVTLPRRDCLRRLVASKQLWRLIAFVVYPSARSARSIAKLLRHRYSSIADPWRHTAAIVVATLQRTAAFRTIDDEGAMPIFDDAVTGSLRNSARRSADL